MSRDRVLQAVIHHFHIDHNVPCVPLHSRCFQFLLGITVVPREIEDKGYAKFFIKQYYGLWENGELRRLLQVTTPISILGNVKVANRASSTKQLKFVPRFFCFSSLFLGIAFTIYVILTIIEWGWVWCEELCKSRRMLSAEVGEGGLRDHENTSDNTKAELHNSFIIFLSPLHRSSSKLFLSTVSGHKQMFFLQIQEYFLPILAFIGVQF